jgi:hypothetical protein
VELKAEAKLLRIYRQNTCAARWKTDSMTTQYQLGNRRTCGDKALAQRRMLFYLRQQATSGKPANLVE